jgi:hypothetical protein
MTVEGCTSDANSTEPTDETKTCAYPVAKRLLAEGEEAPKIFEACLEECKAEVPVFADLKD